jgi:hypothetical protein
VLEPDWATPSYGLEVGKRFGRDMVRDSDWATRNDIDEKA